MSSIKISNQGGQKGENGRDIKENSIPSTLTDIEW